MSRGWPECAQAVATTAMLVEENGKFDFQLNPGRQHSMSIQKYFKMKKWAIAN